MSDNFLLGKKILVLMLFRRLTLLMAFFALPLQSALCSSALHQVWQQADSKRVKNHPDWVRSFAKEASEENNPMKLLAVYLQSPNASVTVYIQAGETRDAILPGSYEFSQGYGDKDGNVMKEDRAVHILKYTENTIDQLKANLSAIQEKYTGKNFMINIFQCKACGKCDGDSKNIRAVVDEVFQRENFVNVTMHKKSILPMQDDMATILMPKTEQENSGQAYKIGYVIAGACLVGVPAGSFFLWKIWKSQSQKKKVM